MFASSSSSSSSSSSLLFHSCLLLFLLISTTNNNEHVLVSAAAESSTHKYNQNNNGLSFSEISGSGKVSVTSSVGAGNNGNSRVRVHIPMSLHNPNGEEHVRADYGFHPHKNRPMNPEGGTVLRYVYYTDSVLCDPVDSRTTKVYPVDTTSKQTNQSTIQQNNEPFILMTVDSSSSHNCSFVKKARMAQEFGASALLVGWGADSTTAAASTTDPQSLPKLVNDGSGYDISIPSFLVGSNLTQRLKQTLKSKNQPVLMELTWGLPPGSIYGDDDDDDGNKKKDVLPSEMADFNYDLWVTALPRDPFMTLTNYDELNRLNDVFNDNKHNHNNHHTNIKVHVTPRYSSIIDGTTFHCPAMENEVGPCDHMCTNYGRYCSIHDRSISGKEIVTETARRLCVHKHYGQEKWFEYVLMHTELCAKPDQYSNLECIQKAYKAAKIDDDANQIDGCVTDSGGLDDDRVNSLLQDQIDTVKERSSAHLMSLPAITVTKGSKNREIRLLKQPLVPHLFEAICDHYWYLSDTYDPKLYKVPEVCMHCAHCPNVMDCVTEGHNKGCQPFDEKRGTYSYHDHKDHKNKSGGGGAGWFVTLLFLGLLGGGGYYYYSKTRARGENPFSYYSQGGGGGEQDASNQGLLNRYFTQEG